MRRHAKHARPTGPVGRCGPCDKLLHPSRKAAKSWLSRRYRRLTGTHDSVYECPVQPGLFHVGHLARPVITGDADRDTIYGNHRDYLRTRGADPMTAYTSTSPDYDRPTPATVVHRSRPAKTAAAVPVDDPTLIGDYTVTASRTVDTDGTDRPGDRTTGQLDYLLSDLTTYRVVEQVPVTPALAKRLIERNAANNRNLKPKTLQRYVDDMLGVGGGVWIEKTGQTLSISTDGTILNGQHRLHAVVRSGRTIRFDLCFGVDPKAMIVIDSGPGRSGVDVVRIAGGEDLSKVAPLMRYIMAFDAGQRMGPAGYVVSPMRLYARYDENGDGNRFQASVKRGRDLQIRIKTPAIVGAVAHFLIVRDGGNKDAVESFFDQLLAGVGNDYREGSAIYALRERLISARADRLKTPEMIALIIIAWNRFNTFSHGRRITVDRVQLTRGELTSSNYPLPQPFRASANG